MAANRSRSACSSEGGEAIFILSATSRACLARLAICFLVCGSSRIEIWGFGSSKVLGITVPLLCAQCPTTLRVWLVGHLLFGFGLRGFGFPFLSVLGEPPPSGRRFTILPFAICVLPPLGIMPVTGQERPSKSPVSLSGGP